jgi:preprotein translocase subunit SecF
MSRMSRFGNTLYSGERSYDFVGRRRRWFAISGAIFLVALGGLLVRGLNLGIEFTGGAEFQVPSATCTIAEARSAAEGAGATVSTATQLGNESIRITTEAVEQGESLAIREALADTCDVTVEDVSAQVVGPTWGGEITQKAVTALAVFLGLLAVFLAIYFDWRMAVAAIVALIHDIVITIGVYALFQFEVTPSTVIGVLTILGFSLYDTVVVFDKVKENTRGILGQSRQTYSQAANLALNQTLVRSINTSIVALLPVASILVVGAGLLGAGTLKDLALALFVGTAAGTYSSIFIATPFLCMLMERNPQMQALARRVQSRGGGSTSAARPKAATAQGAAPAGGTTATAVVEDEPEADAGDEALQRARARRATGPRNQPKRTTKSQR